MADVITYTTCPEDYDGFGTRTIAVMGTCSSGRTIRKVETPERHVDWQRNRYYSGGIYLVADEQKWSKLVEYNLVELADV